MAAPPELEMKFNSALTLIESLATSIETIQGEYDRGWEYEELADKAFLFVKENT